MITMLDDFPDNAVAAVASGYVTRQDYTSVLIPRVEAASRLHPKIRCYYEIGGDFSGMEPGAIWQDLVVGVEYLTRWERVAVVTDVGWIAKTVNALGFLMPGLRVFPLAEREAARAWVLAP